MRCEDFPCCGHVENGEVFCPDEEGRFMCAGNCGTKLAKDAGSSLCSGCLHYDDEDYWDEYD